MPKLQEQARKMEDRVASLRESIERRWDVESDETTRRISESDASLVALFGSPEEAIKRADQWMSGRKNARKIRESLYEVERTGRLREATAYGTMAALTRLGANEIMADAWKEVPHVWEDVCFQTTAEAGYLPIANSFMPSLPREVRMKQEFPQAQFQPMGKIEPMIKVGHLIEVPTELEEDDQTSQIGQLFSRFGKGIGIWKEIAFAATLTGQSITEGDLTITPKTYTDPDGTTGLYTTSGNRKNKTSNATPTANALNAMNVLLKSIKDTDGKKVLVTPDTLVYDPTNDFLIQKTFAGSANDIMLTTTSSGTSVLNTTELTSSNPFKGKLKLLECRYLPAGAWYYGESKSFSFIEAEREGIQVLKESPDSGKSFEFDCSRWRDRWRGAFTVAPGGARFWTEGSSGN
jgi:hypothetical protein